MLAAFPGRAHPLPRPFRWRRKSADDCMHGTDRCRQVIRSVTLRTECPADPRYLSSIASGVFTTRQLGMSKHKIRSGIDRRQDDIGPPNKVAERRRQPDRRLPQLTDMPFEEFEAELTAMGKQYSGYVPSSSSG